MLTVEEALSAILREVRPFPATYISLSDALGLVLAEAVASDVDSPPFDKALMDGFAVRSADMADGRAALELIEEVTAGEVPSKEIRPGQTTQIMTGAPIPVGADAVVRVEDAHLDRSTRQVHVATTAISPGMNILKRGTAMRQGECVLPAGRRLRPQELGALAEIGKGVVHARRKPTVGVLATGNELVPIDATPGPGQIRNSNETLLTAQIRRAGAEPLPLGIARDERSHLRERIEAGLHCDVLLLSGGVSAGVLDLVPAELEAAGVRRVFHKVHVKPGQPIWFGVLDGSGSASGDSETRPRYVFGLPGNPVSSLVCFELFARTAIRRLMGVEPAGPTPVRARLAAEHLARGPRPTYHPARLDWEEMGPVVRPVVWHGSSDLRGTVEANAMALFPAGDKTYQPGDVIDVYLWDCG